MQSLEERPLGDDRTATAPVDRDGAPPASIAGGDGDVGDERSGRERALVAVVVVVAAAALAALTVARLRGAVSLFLSPDGAHYLADADALLGHGVRAIAHPPAFPALVAATEGLVSSAAQVQLALAVSLAALAISIYWLCRQFGGVPASIVGAGIGVTFPAFAELMSWNGGATLLATVFLCAMLASNERWLRRGSAWSALATGGFAALALLSHPFVAGVGFACVGMRWLVELATRSPRRISWRGGPFGLTQLGLLALPVLVALPIALPYYASVEADAGVKFGVPKFGAVWDTLVWGLREQGVLLLLFLAFAIAAFLGGRASATIAGTIGVVYLLVSSASKADPSYRTRVAYLLPVVGAIGATLLWDRFVPDLAAHVRRRGSSRTLVPIAIALVAVMVFASLGFLPRLPVAAAFYQRLDPVDEAALHTLGKGSGGLVATSWNQNAYGNGISNSWYVEGLARRRAAGPTDPALSTLASEKVVGAEMQQFFAGEAGVQNGVAQLSISPATSFGNPGLQAFQAGMYRPVLYVNDNVSGYPAPLGRDSYDHDLAADATVVHDVTASGIEGTYTAGGATAPALSMHADLDGDVVRYEYTVASGPRAGLAIRLFPGYGVLWRDLRQDSSGLQLTSDPFTLTGVSTAGARGIRVVVRAQGGSQLTYLQRDPQFGLQSVEISPDAAGRVSFTVRLGAQAPVGPVRRFDQATLIHRLHITDVVLWKDTGWKSRFDAPCFHAEQETLRLLVFHVSGSCIAAPPPSAPVATPAGTGPTAPEPASDGGGDGGGGPVASS